MKKSFLKRKPADGEVTLQITSMADIFTIILVFILKSFATGSINITPSPGMMIPQAHAAETPVEALKVEIARTSVQIEAQPAAALDEFHFIKGDVQGNGVSRALSEAFEKARKRQLMIAQANSDVKVDPKLVVVADQRTPYSSIKTVLASAAVHGFTDFKLAVIQAE